MALRLAVSYLQKFLLIPIQQCFGNRLTQVAFPPFLIFILSKILIPFLRIITNIILFVNISIYFFF